MDMSAAHGCAATNQANNQHLLSSSNKSIDLNLGRY